MEVIESERFLGRRVTVGGEGALTSRMLGHTQDGAVRSAFSIHGTRTRDRERRGPGEEGRMREGKKERKEDGTVAKDKGREVGRQCA